MSYVLYEFAPTRAKRVKWTLLELEIPFDVIDGPNLIGSEKLRKIHPLAAVPAMTINDKPLFESAAICTYLADNSPHKELISPSGTWARAMHDQWVSFALTEMEMYVWTIARNKFVLPKEKRLSNIFEQNAEGYRRGATVLENVLNQQDFLIGNTFSVTDIIVSFTINWGRNIQLLETFPNLNRYLDRLYERQHCTLRPE
tara:strand:+ start:409 stop:1008 length:600 start_codon:yes stop_codon:yes gene_type:complete